MSQPLLEVRQLSKRYEKSTGLFGSKTIQALSQVSFELREGQTLAIVGETGSGKSTLAKLLIGIEKPDQGEILLEGKPIEITNYRDYNHVIRYIFQDPARSLNPHQKIGQVLKDVLAFSSELEHTEHLVKVNQTLRQVGLLQEHQEFYPHMLSSGQLQRVALARALILDPKLLILDEALTAMDPSLRAQIVNLLLELQKKHGLSYLLITNNLRLVRHMADQLLVLHQGNALDYSDTETVFASPQYDYSKKLISSAFS